MRPTNHRFPVAGRRAGRRRERRAGVRALEPQCGHPPGARRRALRPPAAASLRPGAGRAIPVAAVAARRQQWRGPTGAPSAFASGARLGRGHDRTHRGRRPDHRQLLLHRLEERRPRLGDVPSQRVARACPRQLQRRAGPGGHADRRRLRRRAGHATDRPAQPRDVRRRRGAGTGIPARDLLRGSGRDALRPGSQALPWNGASAIPSTPPTGEPAIRRRSSSTTRTGCGPRVCSCWSRPATRTRT